MDDSDYYKYREYIGSDVSSSSDEDEDDDNGKQNNDGQHEDINMDDKTKDGDNGTELSL